jgi:hypothetical protein
MVISIYRYILYEPHRWCNGSKMKKQNKNTRWIIVVFCKFPSLCQMNMYILMLDVIMTRLHICTVGGCLWSYRLIAWCSLTFSDGSKMKKQNKQLARVLEIACLSPDRVKDYKIMLLHVALRSKNKDWLARNRDTMP